MKVVPSPVKRWIFPAASPIIRSLIKSPFKSPKVGYKLRAGVFNVVFRLILESPKKSSVSNVNSGFCIVPVFLLDKPNAYRIKVHRSI